MFGEDFLPVHVVFFSSFCSSRNEYQDWMGIKEDETDEIIMYHRRSIYQGEATRQNINKEKGRKKRERKGQTTEERGEFVQREKDEDDRKANSGIIYHLVLAIEQRAFCFSIFIHRLICPRSLSLSLST